MNIFTFSILIFFSTEAMIDVGLAGLSQMKVSFLGNFSLKWAVDWILELLRKISRIGYFRIMDMELFHSTKCFPLCLNEDHTIQNITIENITCQEVSTLDITILKLILNPKNARK